jgi:hypothetical protein
MQKTKFRPTADELFHVDPVNHVSAQASVKSRTSSNEAGWERLLVLPLGKNGS